MRNVTYISPIALNFEGDVYLCLKDGRRIEAELLWSLPSTIEGNYTYAFQYEADIIIQPDYIACVIEREEQPEPEIQVINVIREVERSEEHDPVFTAWLEEPPDISTFENDVGYITEEDDPIFRRWLKKKPTLSQFINDVGYVVGGLTLETDPIFTASPAFTITNADIANWNLGGGGPEADPIFTAWLAGPPNVSTFTNDAGYITSWGPETDPVFAAWLSGPPAISTFTNDTGYLTAETDPVFAAWLSGPPAVSTFTNDAGYLTVETDPVFTASPAAGIAAGDITHWDTAYGWGNHATAGYLTSVTPHPLLNTTHSDTVPAAVVKGDLIVGNATPDWERLPANATATPKYLQSVSGGVPTWETVSGGVGTPGGADTQMQYNNSGSFGGTHGITTDGTDLILTEGIKLVFNGA